MSMKEYQAFTRTTAIYPEANTGSTNELMYLSLGLAGESGEVANKIKKLYRDGDGAEKRLKIGAELGDVFWYAVRLQDALGFVSGMLLSVGARVSSTIELMQIAFLLSNEVGDVVKRVNWVCDDLGNETKKEAAQHEIGDVFDVLIKLCSSIGLDPEQVITANMEKLSGRKSRGTLGGDGDIR